MWPKYKIFKKKINIFFIEVNVLIEKCILYCKYNGVCVDAFTYWWKKVTFCVISWFFLMKKHSKIYALLNFNGFCRFQIKGVAENYRTNSRITGNVIKKKKRMHSFIIVDIIRS